MYYLSQRYKTVTHQSYTFTALTPAVLFHLPFPLRFTTLTYTVTTDLYSQVSISSLPKTLLPQPALP